MKTQNPGPEDKSLILADIIERFEQHGLTLANISPAVAEAQQDYETFTAHQAKYRREANNATGARGAATRVARKQTGSYAGTVDELNAAASGLDPARRAVVFEMFEHGAAVKEHRIWTALRSASSGVEAALSKVNDEISARVLAVWPAIPDGITSPTQAAKLDTAAAEMLELSRAVEDWYGLRDLVGELVRYQLLDTPEDLETYTAETFLVGDYETWTRATLPHSRIVRVPIGLDAAGVRFDARPPRPRSRDGQDVRADAMDAQLAENKRTAALRDEMSRGRHLR